MQLLYIFAAIMLLVALLTIASNWRLPRIRRDRKGNGFTSEQFVEAFRPIKIPDDIPAAAYDNYRSRRGWEDFPFLPGDEYSKVLYDDPDDLDEDALALIKRLGKAMLPEYILRERGDKPIKTLRDMVMWLDWVRQYQPANYGRDASLQGS
jgi:hypothetical protein